MIHAGNGRKKQFSLSLLVRVFLTLLVVVSLVVFATSIMKYNELLKEQKALEEQRQELQNEKEELIELRDAKNTGDESYIIRMARKIWRLFFPDEEIVYNN